MKLVKISDRQKDLLGKIVEEYIYSARPVSSQLLEKKYEFGICPATIRNEMQVLTREGYLLQPHISAGRIPTDKAYRFFVDELLEKEFLETANNILIQSFLKETKKDIFEFIEQTTKFLAEASSGFAASCVLENDFISKKGWKQILKEPEFANRGFLNSFFELLEVFEKEVKNLDIGPEIKIYIGKESPLKASRDFSMILTKCDFPEKGEGIISLLGPKRMDYNKNINLLNVYKELLETL